MERLERIYGQFLARAVRFPSFGVIWSEISLSLSFLLSWAEHKGREGERRKEEERKRKSEF